MAQSNLTFIETNIEVKEVEIEKSTTGREVQPNKISILSKPELCKPRKLMLG